MTNKQISDAKRVIVALAQAIVETVNEAGAAGAPAGAMYLAFSEHGISLDTFEAICSALQKAGQIRRHGYLYYPTRGKLPRRDAARYAFVTRDVD